MSYEVFISYAREDRATAEAICQHLEKNHISCWIAPRDILPGKDWAEAIIEAIPMCRILVLVLTAHANNSRNVRREIECATNTNLVRILCRFEDVSLSKALQYFFCDPHWFSAQNRPEHLYLEELGQIVEAHLGRTPKDHDKREPVSGPSSQEPPAGRTPTGCAHPEPDRALSPQEQPPRGASWRGRSAGLGILALAALGVALLWWWNIRLPPPTPPTGTLPAALRTSRSWILYTARGYDPVKMEFPEEASLRADLERLYRDGWRGLVTYAFDGTLSQVPRLAKSIGFTHVIAGLYWQDEAQLQRELAAVPAANQFVDAYVLGHEGLLQQRYTHAELAAQIAALKRQTGKPVTTTEPFDQYLANPTLLATGDWVFPTIAPADRLGPRKDVTAIVGQFVGEFGILRDRLHAVAPSRLAVVKLTLWLTAGDPAASEDDQVTYFQELAKTGAPFVWGESYDQVWKQSPPFRPVDYSTGLYHGDGTPKKVIGQLRPVYTGPYPPTAD